jgi:hypothetical protein
MTNMPKGVYKRKPRINSNKTMIDRITHVTVPEIYETDEEIEQRIAERFEILENMIDSIAAGVSRSLIVSGPAGVGKSHAVMTRLSSWGIAEESAVKGYVKATGLFKLLYRHRNPGSVLVLDDSDAIYFDDTSLGFLKAVCDTNGIRIVSYLSEGVLIDEESAEKLPKSFQFNGTIVFITNYDFDDMIARGHRLAPHLQALISRSHYIDLAMKTSRDYIIRIRQVLKTGLLNKIGLDSDGQNDVIDFIMTNKDSLRELSLRMALKVASIRRLGNANWYRVARITCCRN